MINQADIRGILEKAVLAPSAHNAQPWKIRIAPPAIKVYLDERRLMPVGDPENRQAYISIGCLLKAIAVSAALQGHTVETRYEHAGDITKPVAILTLTKTDANLSALRALAENLETRLSNRFPYKEDPLDPRISSYIAAVSDTSIQTHIVSESSARDRVARIAVDAAVTSMDSTAFRRELSHHVLSNVSRAKIGIPAFAMGIPTVMSFAVPILLRYFNMSRLSRRADMELLSARTPALVVLTGTDDPLSWVRAGEAYMDISLYAASCGYATAPWAAPIEVPASRRDMERAVGTAERVHVLFRIGIPTRRVQPSPRLSADDIIM